MYLERVCILGARVRLEWGRHLFPVPCDRVLERQVAEVARMILRLPDRRFLEAIAAVEQVSIYIGGVNLCGTALLHFEVKGVDPSSLVRVNLREFLACATEALGRLS